MFFVTLAYYLINVNVLLISLSLMISVENSEQFDAARNFLKELDVTDSVWIGLMRPTNADRFSWT